VHRSAAANPVDHRHQGQGRLPGWQRCLAQYPNIDPNNPPTSVELAITEIPESFISETVFEHADDSERVICEG
jgi:hypothetical protein